MPDDKKSTPAKVTAEDNSSKLLAAISYLLGVFAIIIYLLKKDDKFVKFHAMQAVLLNMLWFAVFVLWAVISTILAVVTIPVGGVGGMAWFCVLPIGLVALVAVIYGLWKAFQGEMYQMPLVGKFAEQFSG